MKIGIAYPPLLGHIKGTPQISQNRQFQYTTGGLTAYVIYPIIPAYAATMLHWAGHQVLWLDGIAQKQTYRQWEHELCQAKPDLLVMESKTPVIKTHWQIINQLKKKLGQKLVTVLVGDHVTALPRESLAKSKVDYVLTGGDWDWLLVNLAKHLAKGERLEPGIYFKAKGKVKNTGQFRLKHDLNKLPLLDRDLTHWQDYAYRNSNFYRAPGAYTMFGRDCWWGRCSFCSWTTLYPGEKYRILPVEKAMAEVENLVTKYGVKEIMDDSGTFANGAWLRRFCQLMIKTGLNKKVAMNCNMRFNASLSQADYNLMGEAGFRFILYGLESANQSTLDKLNKNLSVKQIKSGLAMAKQAGLWPHITVMVGYPWEGKQDIARTVQLVKEIFHQGLANSMQATIVIPYPGTPLFRQCQQKGWLRTTDWQDYDMSQPIMKTKLSSQELFSIIKDLYSASIWNQTFLTDTFKQLTTWDGIKYVGFQGLKYLGKLLQFA